MQKNFSTNQLRPFRDRDVVWYTPLLPIVGGAFVYIMVFLAGYLENLLELQAGFLPHALAYKGVGAVVGITGLIFFTFGAGRAILFMRKKRGRKFITNGVYRYSRNPSSFGLMATVFGVSLMLNFLSLFLIALTVLLFFILSVYYVDRLLYKTYGEEFLKYKNSTPRFIPNFNRLFRNMFGLD